MCDSGGVTKGPSSDEINETEITLVKGEEACSL
jgi:hypothetical protein